MKSLYIISSPTLHFCNWILFNSKKMPHYGGWEHLVCSLLPSVWFIHHQTLSVKFKCALQVIVFACGATLSAKMQKIWFLSMVSNAQTQNMWARGEGMHMTLWKYFHHAGSSEYNFSADTLVSFSLHHILFKTPSKWACES